MAESWFKDVELAPPIEVFALTQSYNDDTDPSKVNLGVGAYRTDDGKPWVLPVVRTVESQMAADQTLNHEYLPVSGFPDHCQAGKALLLGSDSPAILQNRADAVQAVGGTGALRIALDFLKKCLGMDAVYVSQPTWGNHKGIAKSLGYGAIKEYRYWDDKGKRLDLVGMIEDLENAPSRSVIIIHMCAHNPSGIDPTRGEWQQIANIIKTKHHFPLFDCAYQGFASGDLDKDAGAIRMFVKQGFELFGAQSFSKNFGLYNERVGNLIYVADNAECMPKMKSQLKMIVRTTYSNPPNHGSRIVATVLNNPALCSEWKIHVRTMAERILKMRQMLHEKLQALQTPGNWDHVIKQAGMFSYTGLNKMQVDHLLNVYHIYLLSSGRINMCAITTKNVDYVAKAIHDAVTKIDAEPKL